jgi:hypothetical protein
MLINQNGSVVADMPEVTQPASSQNDVVLAELKQLHADVNEVRGQVTAIEEKVHSKDPEVQAKEEGKQSSKLALALGMGLVGFKVITGIGLKLATAAYIIRERKAGRLKKLDEKTIESLEGMMHDKQFIKDAFVSTGVGALVGGGGGAALGWKRGDRIAKPEDLVLHPIDSFRKIFLESGPDKTASQANDKDKNWQDKVQSAPAERER